MESLPLNTLLLAVAELVEVVLVPRQVAAGVVRVDSVRVRLQECLVVKLL